MFHVTALCAGYVHVTDPYPPRGVRLKPQSALNIDNHGAAHRSSVRGGSFSQKLQASLADMYGNPHLPQQSPGQRTPVLPVANLPGAHLWKPGITD